MIYLDLGDEPAALTTARINGIRKVAAILPATSVIERKVLSDAITGYGPTAVRKVLHARQHGKCAWCERPIGRTGNPVDHVRPKLGADEQNGHRDIDHYWWLAWTWNNLVYACACCNSKGNKGNRYWLVAGTKRLSSPLTPVTLPIGDAHIDVSAEKPLLVHPRLEDPSLYLRWLPIDVQQPRSRWRWTLLGRDRVGRGTATIEMLGLSEVEDQVNAHLRGTVLHRDSEIRQHLSNGRVSEATSAWQKMIEDCVDDPEQSFRAAAWCAIESLWPASERASKGFKDPRVPTVPPSPRITP